MHWNHFFEEAFGEREKGHRDASTPATTTGTRVPEPSNASGNATLPAILIILFIFVFLVWLLLSSRSRKMKERVYNDKSALKQDEETAAPSSSQPPEAAVVDIRDAARYKRTSKTLYAIMILSIVAVFYALGFLYARVGKAGTRTKTGTVTRTRTGSDTGSATATATSSPTPTNTETGTLSPAPAPVPSVVQKLIRAEKQSAAVFLCIRFALKSVKLTDHEAKAMVASVLSTLKMQVQSDLGLDPEEHLLSDSRFYNEETYEPTLLRMLGTLSNGNLNAKKRDRTMKEMLKSWTSGKQQHRQLTDPNMYTDAIEIPQTAVCSTIYCCMNLPIDDLLLIRAALKLIQGKAEAESISVEWSAVRLNPISMPSALGDPSSQAITAIEIQSMKSFPELKRKSSIPLSVTIRPIGNPVSMNLSELERQWKQRKTLVCRYVYESMVTFE